MITLTKTIVLPKTQQLRNKLDAAKEKLTLLENRKQDIQDCLDFENRWWQRLVLWIAAHPIYSCGIGVMIAIGSSIAVKFYVPQESVGLLVIISVFSLYFLWIIESHLKKSLIIDYGSDFSVSAFKSGQYKGDMEKLVSDTIPKKQQEVANLQSELLLAEKIEASMNDSLEFPCLEMMVTPFKERFINLFGHDVYEYFFLELEQEK